MARRWTMVGMTAAGVAGGVAVARRRAKARHDDGSRVFEDGAAPGRGATATSSPLSAADIGDVAETGPGPLGNALYAFLALLLAVLLGRRAPSPMVGPPPPGSVTGGGPAGDVGALGGTGAG